MEGEGELNVEVPQCYNMGLQQHGGGLLVPSPNSHTTSQVEHTIVQTRAPTLESLYTINQSVTSPQFQITRHVPEGKIIVDLPAQISNI